MYIGIVPTIPINALIMYLKNIDNTISIIGHSNKYAIIINNILSTKDDITTENILLIIILFLIRLRVKYILLLIVIDIIVDIIKAIYILTLLLNILLYASFVTML